MRGSYSVAVAALCCLAPLGARAQDAVAPQQAQGESEVPVAALVPAVAIVPSDVTGPSAESAASARSAIVPALTEISVEILADLGSKTSTTGDTFPLRLAAPIVIDGVELVPAGTAGMGEVIHAKKS